MSQLKMSKMIEPAVCGLHKARVFVIYNQKLLKVDNSNLTSSIIIPKYYLHMVRQTVNYKRLLTGY